jgi:hypothetical protein
MDWRARTLAPLVLAGVAAAVAPAVHADDVSAARPAEAPPAYEDQLIEGGLLAPDDSDDGFAFTGGSGLPRAWRLEAVKTVVENGGRSVTEDGALASFFAATGNYGSFSFDGALRTSGDIVASLWQRDMPFNNGWRAANGLGIVASANIDLVRRQFRFFLPATPIAGASTEWRGPQGWNAAASIGEPGFFTGLRVPKFNGLGGTVVTGGAQTDVAPGVATGVQVTSASRLANLAGTPLGDASARAVFAGASYSGPNGFLAQANVVTSELAGEGTRAGAWADAFSRYGNVLFNYGTFYLQPRLAWANQPITSGIAGGYFRAAQQSARWGADGGVDVVAPVDGPGSTALFATGSARYQYTARTSFGGGANVRTGGANAYSAFGYLDQRTSLGITRGRVDVFHNDFNRDVQFTLDQNWRMPPSIRINTAAYWLHANDRSLSSDRWGVFVYGGGDVNARVTVDGGVRWVSAGPLENRGTTYANVGLNWNLGRGFSLAAYAYDTRYEIAQQLTVLSPITLAGLQPVSLRDRGLFLTLRYEGRSGRPTVPLGGAPGQGYGRIAGVVFLDGNDDGFFQPGEAGAQGVTLLLDGRFVTRTDAAGRYEFPEVAAGRHTVELVPDNLPLPYAPRQQGRMEVEVPVRSSVTLDLGATARR